MAEACFGCGTMADCLTLAHSNLTNISSFVSVEQLSDYFRTAFGTRRKQFTTIGTLVFLQIIVSVCYLANIGHSDPGVAAASLEQTSYASPSLILTFLRWFLRLIEWILHLSVHYMSKYWLDTAIICMCIYALYRFCVFLYNTYFSYHDHELAEDAIYNVNSSLILCEENILSLDSVGSVRIAGDAAMHIKSTKGILQKSPANDLVITRLASDYMLNTVGMRPKHVAQTMPFVHGLVYLPTDNEILAAKLSASNQYAKKRAELAHATNAWIPDHWGYHNYREVGSMPAST